MSDKATAGQRISDALIAAGITPGIINIDIYGDPTQVRVTPPNGSTYSAAQQQTITSTLAAFDWSDTANTTYVTSAGQGMIDGGDPMFQLVRAVALADIDGQNILRDWLTSFVAAVAAATSLADLKTRVAALPALPDITPTQAKAAIKAKFGS